MRSDSVVQSGKGKVKRSTAEAMRSGAKQCCARLRLSIAARGYGRAWYCSGNAGNSRVLRRQGVAWQGNVMCGAGKGTVQQHNATLRRSNAWFSDAEALRGKARQRNGKVLYRRGKVLFGTAKALYGYAMAV